MWILTIRSSTNDPLVYILKAGKNRVGRKQDNDIVILDESVSRWHAEIEYQTDRLIVRDLKSKNGTFVNQVRIDGPKPLKSGDQIHFGQCVARLFQRATSSLSIPVDDLSETKPRVREMPTEPLDQRAALLYEVANRLTTISDLEKALQETSTLIRNAMDADCCAVLLADGFDRLEELGFSTAIARQAIEQRAPVLVHDPTAKNKRPPGKSSRLLHIRTAVCVPVMIDEEVAGLVYLYKSDPAAALYDENDMRLVMAIGRQTALTIQRARLLEQAQILKKWALTDGLTGLNNRRQTLNLAQLEFQRAQSLQRPLTLLMLDIDRFKQVNDNYGHPVGDHVLKAAAMRFRGQLRSFDTLGRYGGDEFLVLLVDTGQEGGQAIAERLRLCVCEAPFETGHGLVEVTVSIGVAALVEDCTNITGLIEQADRALYAAKRAGRNRVRLAD